MRVRRAVLVALLVVLAVPARATPALAGPGGVRGGGKPGYPTTIAWAGRTWQVKASQSRVGPGPNYFSAAPENVWVDGAGRLHLRITHRDGRWYCAEVIGNESFGYGTYGFTLASAIGALDPNIVLGLFTWSDKGAFHHRELDVEIARWGSASDPTNGQYVVQPYSVAGHLERWTQPVQAAPTLHGFTWRPGQVAFASTDLGAWSHAWTYVGSDVPKPGGENVRLNLWLFGGAAPQDGQEAEVAVEDFRFTP